MEHSFQINLHGIIKLLSEHLYSGPQVYIRELIQNAVDALRARGKREPGHSGNIEIELRRGADGRPGLMIQDNGIGLTEAEVHQFLSVIGKTSKTAELFEQRDDFIGQFGIGLLSCFLVAERICVVTRSMQGDAAAVRWQGLPNGTYTIEEEAGQMAPGTVVILECKAGAEAYFEPDFVLRTARDYAGLLDYPIQLRAGERYTRINPLAPPWREEAEQPAKAALLEFGREQFGTTFLDATPLRSAAGQVAGIAYVLPFAPRTVAKGSHRVYLKNMLLADNVDNLLPDWAFFVRCIVNANDLRPTASRESFYEDAQLHETRAALGVCLRDYLKELAQSDPKRLQEIIGIHFLAMKALAVEDEEFYRIIIDFLPFETTMGRITLGEYKRHNRVLRFVPVLDQYRQVAQVAAAQSMWLINAGYVYDADLLAMHEQVFPGCRAEAVDVGALTHEFTELSADERKAAFRFLNAADRALTEYSCDAQVKKFLPEQLPALFILDQGASFVRSVEQSKEVSDAVWGGVLERLAESTGQTQASVCFNYNNPLIQKLVKLEDEKLLGKCATLLYVQALLLGHHPLNAKEMQLLNTGLLDLIEWGIDTQSKAGQVWPTSNSKLLN